MDAIQITVSILTGLGTGMVVTQLTGDGKRSIFDGILAWLLIPLCLLGCFILGGSEGLAGMKSGLNDFAKTLMNFKE